MHTHKMKISGLHTEINAQFEAWIAKSKLQNGGQCVGFQTLHDDFNRFLGGALPVTRQYFGTLLSAKFRKRISRASARISNVHYCLNRDPSQPE